MTSAPAKPASHNLPDAFTWQNTWRKICLNIDGIAVGSTIAALTSHGVLDILVKSDTFILIDDLAKNSHAKRAYLHLALKLLSSQGLVQRCKNNQGQTLVRLTPDGHAWYPLHNAYRDMPSLLAASYQFSAMLRGKIAKEAKVLKILADSLDEPSGETSDRFRERVHLHRLGPGIAASLSALASQPHLIADNSTVRTNDDMTELACRLLSAQGWMSSCESGYHFTAEGKMACKVVGQYNMAFCYIPTFRQVSQLIFPISPHATTLSDEFDAHLDRQLDIEFSGEVFTRHCRTPLLQVVLPLFEHTALAHQPKLLVDTGCGDGSLLVELYTAIRDETQRGANFSTHPLLVVGADVSPIARETTAKRLAAANIPHLVLEGDIGQPAALATALGKHGYDFREALHLSKSVIHNRHFSYPQNEDQGTSRIACSDGVFIAEDDSLIPGSVIEQNLVEHFRSWVPWTQRHGMVVIEAHNLPTDVSATLVGHSVISMLEASHGYSHQYPMEAKCHRALAREAGYRAKSTSDLVSLAGQPLLTLDHLIPEV